MASTWYFCMAFDNNPWSWPGVCISLQVCLEVPEYALSGQEQGDGHGQQLPGLDEHVGDWVELGVSQVCHRVGRGSGGGVTQEPRVAASTQQQVLQPLHIQWDINTSSDANNSILLNMIPHIDTHQR